MAGGKKAIAVGVVGYPNVGKSSVINSLKRSQVVKTGGTAGVTRSMQEVVLDSKVRLIDCPGVVFSGKSEDAGVVLRNAVKVEHIKDPVRVVEDLTRKIEVSQLGKHFGIAINEEIQKENGMRGMDMDVEQPQGRRRGEIVKDFLIQVAQHRGFLKRGGAADFSRAAVHVLMEIAQGKFRYHVLPDLSKRADIETAVNGDIALAPKVIISETAEEFDVEAMETVKVLKEGNQINLGTASSTDVQMT